jgi:hypothetical protein
MCIFIYTYININMYVYICIKEVHLGGFMALLASLGEYIYIYRYLFIVIYGSMYIYISIYMCVYIFTYLYIYKLGVIRPPRDVLMQARDLINAGENNESVDDILGTCMYTYAYL